MSLVGRDRDSVESASAPKFRQGLRPQPTLKGYDSSVEQVVVSSRWFRSVTTSVTQHRRPVVVVEPPSRVLLLPLES